MNNIDDTYDALINELKDFDIIDVLEKLSLTRYYVTTSVIKIKQDERAYYRYLYDSALCYLFPFSMCYGFKGIKSIDFSSLLNVCKTIASLKCQSFMNEAKTFDKDSYRIEYLQNNLTDTLEPFKHIPLVYLLSCNDDIIYDNFHVKCEDIFTDTVQTFREKFFAIKFTRPITQDEFVNNLDKYIDRSCFEIKQNQKSYSICSKLSFSIGEISNEYFDSNSTLSIIDKKRKIFISRDGIVYNIHSDIVCNRLKRCIENLITNKKDRQSWFKNYKEKTEFVPEELLTNYLFGGKYFKNVFYKDKDNNLCECDGIYIYYDFIFTVEVKGTKFNPDSINENNEKVLSSYDNVVKQVDNQSIRIRSALLRDNEFEILDEKGKVKETIGSLNNKNIISLCIFFEDIGTYLSGVKTEENDSIYISFYDLHLVCYSLGNPILICKYFLERSAAIYDQRYNFNDELMFVSMFAEYLNLNGVLNNQSSSIENNVGEIMISNYDFGEDVELKLLSGKKIEMKLPKTVRQILNLKDYSLMDDDLFTCLISLLNFSLNELYNFDLSYAKNNRGKNRLPQVLLFQMKNGKSLALMTMPRSHNPYQKKQNLAYVKKYFEYRKDADLSICFISVGNNYSEYQHFYRNDILLKDNDLDSLIKDVGFSIKEHKSFDK